MPNVQKFTVEISKFLLGMDETIFGEPLGGALLSLGIDPEYPLGSFNNWPADAAVPTCYAPDGDAREFISDAPMFIASACESGGVWVLDANGSLSCYNGLSLGGGVGIGNPGGAPIGNPCSAGNGMVVYNDYVYCATFTDIYRHGRISQTAPAFAQYWTTTLAMSALTNTNYPATRTVHYPNHFLHKHTDGYVYVADYDGERGRIHRFITDSDGTGGAAEWKVLSLPPKMMPFSMASYGTDLAIVCSPDARYALGGIPIGQASGTVYLWDAVSGNRFYRAIPTSELMVTAAINHNGALKVFAGNLDNGCRLLQYMGGETFSEIARTKYGSPPFAGAVDVSGDAVLWGQAVTDYPTYYAGVMQYGRRRSARKSTLNCIALLPSTDQYQIPSAIKVLSRSSRTPFVGWRDDTDRNIVRETGTAFKGFLALPPVVVGKKFRVRRIRFGLTSAVAAGTSIAVTVYTDGWGTTWNATAGLLDVNATNFPNSDRHIDFRDLTITGNTDFVVAFTFAGTANTGIIPPVTVEYEVYD